MQGKRTDRVGHLIQMELGQQILHRIKDPRLGFVTITHVDISPDLKNARVFFSVLGDQKACEDSQKALEKASGFLQREIGVALKLRFTPKLNFVIDETLGRSGEIDQVLKKIEKEKE